jgi:tellurite resistance protein TerC
MLVLWLLFIGLVIALLAIDLGLIHRKAKEESIREAIWWSVLWITLGVLFSGVVYLIYENAWFGATMAPGDKSWETPGVEAAIRYITGYLLEKSLSVDNLFVIALLMRGFRVPAQHQHRILFWGIIGALVLRGVMIGAGVWLVARFDWVFYIFGAYLAFTGIKLLFVDEEAEDAEDTFFIRLARRALPISKAEPNGRFLTREDGKLRFTKLALVLVAVEGTDVIFALDSVPAVLGVTTEGFLVFSSNLFAILGLRALYFVLAGVLKKFHYLSIALSLILVFVGVKMLLHAFFKIPNLVSLGAIVALVTAGILASMWTAHREEADG